MNIYTDIEKGQTISNNFTGNEFEVVRIEKENITILRGGEETTLTEKEIRLNFEFVFDLY